MTPRRFPNLLPNLFPNLMGIPPEKTPEGVIAVGGDLQPETIMDAYRKGIFPWPISPADGDEREEPVRGPSSFLANFTFHKVSKEPEISENSDSLTIKPSKKSSPNAKRSRARDRAEPGLPTKCSTLIVLFTA
jgi:hypothetical protein